MKLILLRHGESQWNLENRFTGWKDVDITVDTLYTSLLLRATHTAEIVSDIIGFDKENIKYDWRLNERHYGALQGLNKSETASKYGEDQVHIWRRSYDIPPPLLSNEDERHPKFNQKFKNIDGDLPIGESLKNVIDRLNPFWSKYLINVKEDLGNHLIIAHSNSLRAIVKILDQLSKEEIILVNIPTGVPLVYTLDRSLNVMSKEYLINDDELKAKQEMVINQGKAK